METSEKLSFFLEILQCTGPISCLVYDQQGNLINQISKYPTIHRFFDLSDCFSHALEQAGNTPLCLGSILGTLWGVVYSGLGENRLIYVIGPAQSEMISREALSEIVGRHRSMIRSRESFIKAFSEFPIIPITLLQQYILMLHYCLNNEKLRIGDIGYQNYSASITRNMTQAVENVDFNYEAERKLLFHIREGDLNYRETSEFASRIGRGVAITTKDPFLRLLISITSFTSLCIRAAIEGGLPPDTAHTVGNAYIQSMVGCHNISELSSLHNAMYVDFVHRVHEIKTGKKLSPQILACCEYIRLHPEEKLSISSLANLVGYTDYYLSRKFKTEVGQGIRDYIDSVRIRRSQMLLETTSMTISEIARSLQYCSGTHFSSVFKSITGQLPREYRQGKIHSKKGSAPE